MSYQVADQAEPGALLVREYDAAMLLPPQPLLEALLHRVGERREHRLLFEGETHERHQIGEASSLRAPTYLLRSRDGECIPQAVLDAIELGHPVVGHHEVEGPLLRRLDGLQRRGVGLDGQAAAGHRRVLAQHALQGRQHVRLVVDEHDSDVVAHVVLR